MTLMHAIVCGSRRAIDCRNDLDGMLADLGVSSLQLGDPARGFSFQAEGPLDMRMNPMSGETAEQVVNHIDERELADVIYEFGEERRSRRIARAIVRSRPIRTTTQLVEVVSAAARSMKHERIHPATRTFQALRIFVNHELDDLKALLEAAPQRAEAGRKAGGDQLSLARRQNRQGCNARRREAGLVPAADEEAGDRERRRDRSQSAVAQRQDAGRRKSVARRLRQRV